LLPIDAEDGKGRGDLEFGSNPSVKLCTEGLIMEPGCELELGIRVRRGVVSRLQ
jgi:hypothetical protein